ncbi:hypothetical protein AB0442_10390 [Kitasatospora sp. NPDC085895]
MSSELLFYRPDNGHIATGRLETNGTFTGLAQGGLSSNWLAVTPVS